MLENEITMSLYQRGSFILVPGRERQSFTETGNFFMQEARWKLSGRALYRSEALHPELKVFVAVQYQLIFEFHLTQLAGLNKIIEGGFYFRLMGPPKSVCIKQCGREASLQAVSEHYCKVVTALSTESQEHDARMTVTQTLYATIILPQPTHNSFAQQYHGDMDNDTSNRHRNALAYDG